MKLASNFETGKNEQVKNHPVENSSRADSSDTSRVKNMSAFERQVLFGFTEKY